MWQYLAAYGAVLALLCLTLVVTPFARMPGPVIPALLAFYQSAVILAYFVTAILLFILYREMAQTDLLMLGSGYLFSGIISYAHFLSFPGLIAPNGVIGGDDQTTPILWLVWHGAFPAAVCIAMYLRARGVRNANWLASLSMALVAVVVAAAGVILTATLWHDYLPGLLLTRNGIGWTLNEWSWVGLVLINLAALVVLGFNRGRHSTLTLWLFVGTVALSLEVMMAWYSSQYYSVAWYASRILGFVGSAVLAGIFIIENALLLRNSSRLARELRTALMEARAATQSKSHFFAAASHDLRQPFQAMRLFYGVLEQSAADKSQRTAIEHLGQAMSNAETLLNELLDIARIENRSLPISCQWTDLRPLIEEVARDLRPVAEHRGLTLRVRGPSIKLKTDRALMKRILQNLVSNAIRYTEKGGVLIATRRRGGENVIEVWDTGIGIAQQDMGKVFEEFYQVANPGRDRTQGTGLGLAIVRRLAVGLECEIKLVSRLGRGSVFTVILPREKKPKQGSSWRR